MYKAAVDVAGLNKTTRENASLKSFEGVVGEKIAEPVPNFIQLPCERVFQGQNNNFIVLGRDRPGNRASGYGGRGDTQCAMIDIVAGRMGSEAAQVNENGEPLYADPDFQRDAARIYVAQKTDVDRNFRLVDGTVGSTPMRSAVVLKADQVRIVARESIKFVTGVDNKNSQGGNTRSIQGIDLIAGNNDSDMQPLVKGQNLQACLEHIMQRLDELNGIVDTFVQSQIEYNTVLAAHIHPSVVGPTGPSIETAVAAVKAVPSQVIATKMSLLNQKINSAGTHFNYLSPASDSYINSRLNHTN